MSPVTTAIHTTAVIAAVGPSTVTGSAMPRSTKSLTATGRTTTADTGMLVAIWHGWMRTSRRGGQYHLLAGGSGNGRILPGARIVRIRRGRCRRRLRRTHRLAIGIEVDHLLRLVVMYLRRRRAGVVLNGGVSKAMRRRRRS